MKRRRKIVTVKMTKDDGPILLSIANIGQRVVSNSHFNDLALRDCGPQLVDIAAGEDSLRSLSRRINVSPTYLSLVRSGQVKVSIPVFMSLLDDARKSRQRRKR